MAKVKAKNTTTSRQRHNNKMNNNIPQEKSEQTSKSSPSNSTSSSPPSHSPPQTYHQVERGSDDVKRLRSQAKSKIHEQFEFAKDRVKKIRETCIEQQLESLNEIIEEMKRADSLSKTLDSRVKSFALEDEEATNRLKRLNSDVNGNGFDKFDADKPINNLTKHLIHRLNRYNKEASA